MKSKMVLAATCGTVQWPARQLPTSDGPEERACQGASAPFADAWRP